MWVHLMTLDLQMLHNIATHRTPLLTYVFIIVTAFGSAPVAALLSITIASLPSLHLERRVLVPIIVATLGGWTGTEILKRWISRPRPSLVAPLVDASGFSFPSGHSVVASAAYLTLAILICPQLHHSVQRFVVFITAVLIVLLIAFSRVYLGVHYPSDVLAGICFGTICAFLVCGSFRIRPAGRFQTPHQQD
jgi:undecaprenyl-diphosphatase